MDDDDWLGGDARPGGRDANVLALVSERPLAIVAGLLVLGCLLIAGLVIGGVFSSSKQPAASTTPPSTRPATTRTPTTTQTSTTESPTASVTGPTTTLNPGDQGSEVVALQRALRSLGYPVGKIDGVYGPVTKSAVARFQTGAHLTADGIFGPVTLAALTGALRGP